MIYGLAATADHWWLATISGAQSLGSHARLRYGDQRRTLSLAGTPRTVSGAVRSACGVVDQ